MKRGVIIGLIKGVEVSASTNVCIPSAHAVDVLHNVVGVCRSIPTNPINAPIPALANVRARICVAGVWIVANTAARIVP